MTLEGIEKHQDDHTMRFCWKTIEKVVNLKQPERWWTTCTEVCVLLCHQLHHRVNRDANNNNFDCVVRQIIRTNVYNDSWALIFKKSEKRKYFVDTNTNCHRQDKRGETFTNLNATAADYWCDVAWSDDGKKNGSWKESAFTHVSALIWQQRFRRNSNKSPQRNIAI